MNSFIFSFWHPWDPMNISKHAFSGVSTWYLLPPCGEDKYLRVKCHPNRESRTRSLRRRCDKRWCDCADLCSPPRFRRRKGGSLIGCKEMTIMSTGSTSSYKTQLAIIWVVNGGLNCVMKGFVITDRNSQYKHNDTHSPAVHRTAISMTSHHFRSWGYRKLRREARVTGQETQHSPTPHLGTSTRNVQELPVALASVLIPSLPGTFAPTPYWFV